MAPPHWFGPDRCDIRDVYYHHPVLFGSQATVDRVSDMLARSFRVQRSDLCLTAAAKGLVTGAVRFSRSDGSSIDLNQDPEALLISSLDDLTLADTSRCLNIVVIEKEVLL